MVVGDEEQAHVQTRSEDHLASRLGMKRVGPGGVVDVEAGGGPAAADLKEALEGVDLRHATYEENERLRVENERKRKVITFDNNDDDDDDGDDGDDGDGDDDDDDGDGDDDDGSDGGDAKCRKCGDALSPALLLSSTRSRRLCATCGAPFTRGVVQLHASPRSDGFFKLSLRGKNKTGCRHFNFKTRNGSRPPVFTKDRLFEQKRNRSKRGRRKPKNRM